MSDEMRKAGSRSIAAPSIATRATCATSTSANIAAETLR